MRNSTEAEKLGRLGRWLIWLSLPVPLWLHFTSDAGRLPPLASLGAEWSRLHALFASPVVDGWLLVRYMVQSYALTFLIILIDLVFGLALLRVLRRGRPSMLPPALSAATALAMGSAAGGAIMFGLGCAHSLDQRSVLGMSAFMAVAGVAAAPWGKARRAAGRLLLSFQISRVNRGLALTVLVLTLPVVALHLTDLMMPVMEFDSTMYHMSAAKLYRETGSMAYHDGIRYNAQPHLPVLLYLRHWFLLGDAGIAKLANVEFSLIILLTLLAASAELRRRDAWILALPFLAAAPVLCWVAKVEYLDLALAAYFGLACALLLSQLRRGNFDLAWPTGLVLGATGACKYQGLVFVAVAFAGVLLAAVLARVRWVRIVRALAIMGFGVVLMGAPWWLRSYTNTGSPFYPFFAPAASSADAQAILSENQVYGPGRTLPSFLLIGYKVATMAPYRFGDPFSLGLPLLLLQAVLGLAVVLAIHSRTCAPGPVFLATVFVVFLTFWFWAAPVQRHLGSLLPVMAMLLLASLKTFKAARRVPVLLTLFCTVLALRASSLTSTVMRTGFLPPVTFAQRDIVLANTLPYYSAVKFLNPSLQPSDMTYLLFVEDARFYLEGGCYGDWYGKYNYEWLSKGTDSLDGIVNKWKEAGFRYVLVNHERAVSAQSIFFPGFADSAFTRPSSDLPGAERLFSDGRYSVFRLE